MESWTIKNGVLEYDDNSHLYLFNGIILPSITQLLKVKFKHKYDGISEDVLKKAAIKGTAVHKAIQDYEEQGTITDCQELNDYIFLKNYYKFKVIENEKPVVLFLDGEPVACGRLDIHELTEDKHGLSDIKRTSVLDKESVTLQLNLYRLAFQQNYDIKIDYLTCLHLRNGIRKRLYLPIDEKCTIETLKEILEEIKNGTKN